MASLNQNLNNSVVQPSQPIRNFISTITDAGGISRPNRFVVSITPPQIINTLGINNQQNFALKNAIAQENQVDIQSLGVVPDYFKSVGVEPWASTSRLQFMCCKAELPGKSFNTSDIRTYGAFFDMPFTDVYANITLTFIVGRDMAERNFFDAWSYLIQDPDTSDFNYVNEYGTTIDIKQLDEYDNKNFSRYNYGCRLYQAWPKQTGEMRLAYDETNTYHTLPITFTYRKWINLHLDNHGNHTPMSIVPTLEAPTLWQEGAAITPVAPPA
jgi:hypothetical protein